jgi:hypothetical protein
MKRYLSIQTPWFSSHSSKTISASCTLTKELLVTLKRQHGDFKLINCIHVLVSECIKSLKQALF